jgi:hypothetical protein
MSPVPANGRQNRDVRLAALPSAVPWARRVLGHMLREWQLQGMAKGRLVRTGDSFAVGQRVPGRLVG